jgi:hypothetical protein
MADYDQRARAFRAEMEARRINQLLGPRYGGGRIQVPRSGPGIGIGPSASGRESVWPVRPNPSASTMRSESARPISPAHRLWPNMR